MLQPQNVVADGFDVGDGVRHKNDRDAPVAQLMHLAHAAVTEGSVANRESFVDQEHLGIHVDGDREGEPYDHAARVRFHRPLNEIADAGEVFDRLVTAIDFAFRKAEDGGVEIDVVAAGEFGVEARAQFEQGGDASVDGDGAGGGLHNAGDELQGGAFAGAVFADDAENFAAFNSEGQIADGVEVAMVRTPAAGQEFFEAVAGFVIQSVVF